MFNYLIFGGGKTLHFIGRVLEDYGRKNYIIPKKQAELGVEMCMETQENRVIEALLYVKTHKVPYTFSIF